jgi:DeoR/GlpR family transcriptional regulator of sugar metabolism
MLECGQEIVVVADATKFGRQALTWLCDLSAVQRVVTDERLSEAHREMLARAGVALSVAALDGDAEPNGRAMSADSSEMEPAR